MKKRALHELHTKVCGIPCIVAVTYYEPYLPATRHAPAEGGHIEWEVRDRRGRPAPWLEAKMTPKDRTQVEMELCAP